METVAPISKTTEHSIGILPIVFSRYLYVIFLATVFVLFDLIVVVFNAWFGSDFVNDSVFLGLFSRKEEIAVGIFGDLIDAFFAVMSENLVQHLTISQNLVCMNVDVADLPADPAVWLVQHDSRVRQGTSFAFSAAGQQHGRAAGSLTDAIRRDRARQHLHRIVNGHRCDHVATGRVQVKVNIFFLVFALQVKQFHNKFVCVPCVDLALKENDSVFQQQVTQGHLALALHSRVVVLRVSNLAKRA